MEDFENNKEEQLVPGRIPLSEVKKQVKELKEAKQAFEESNPKSKRIFDAVSMYSVAVDFAFMIAVPLIAFVFLGKWVDAKFETKYFVVVGIVLGIATSAIAIGQQIKKLSKQVKNKK